MTDMVARGKVDLIDLFSIRDDARVIVAEEGTHIPFIVRRVFVVDNVKAGEMRGKHAHRRCTQILMCLSGQVDVTVTDGRQEQSFSLTTPERALKIPPMFWSTQRYVMPGTILTVLCDEIFDPAEYIRDYDEFLRYGARE